MSGWDWIHAGLELAAFSKAQNAQQQLSEMKTSAEMEATRQLFFDAIRSFVFEISRDIQLVEEQVENSPQQVFIVSKTLGWRLNNQGLSPEIFSDFQDKEYFFKTQKKISEVVERSKTYLTDQQIQESDKAVQYISELPILQQAISAKSAQESLRATENNWQTLERKQSQKKLFIGLGIAGLITLMCVAGPLLFGGITFILSGKFGGVIGGLIMIGIFGMLVVGTIISFILSSHSNNNYAPFKAKREIWKEQLITNDKWKNVISLFGDLTLRDFQREYDVRLSYVNLLLGGDFQNILTSGEKPIL